ncbi:hypothetical protein [Phenylobacterium sp.]|uniref:hypothetical protein n=1 Tax=Phenylobacterium sp. TaxID=1871053 RepID=UPI00374DBFAC
MKFNMGCGHRKLAGFINVDTSVLCEPDEVVDLEVLPWPWPDGCASEIRFIHSLEHMGQTPSGFLGIMCEIYRLATDGCEITIHVPHPRHDNFLNDPTHVRPITAGTLALFDKRLCENALALGGANTPLALMLGLDFETVATETALDEPYFTRLKSGVLSEADAYQLLLTQNNIARELRFVLRARKPKTSSGV